MTEATGYKIVLPRGKYNRQTSRIGKCSQEPYNNPRRYPEREVDLWSQISTPLVRSVCDGSESIKGILISTVRIAEVHSKLN